MKNKEVRKFLDTHRDRRISAAKLEYSRFLNEKEMDDLLFEAAKYTEASEADKEMEALISGATEGAEFIRLMRKPMVGLNRYKLRKKLLANEDLVMSLIQAKALSNRQDLFIENALDFFLHSKANVSDWIVENYATFKSEYLKSMFCLVLGFRGNQEMIPFLISEAERLERLYPDESYDQGPTLAVQELACRFLNTK